MDDICALDNAEAIWDSLGLWFYTSTSTQYSRKFLPLVSKYTEVQIISQLIRLLEPTPSPTSVVHCWSDCESIVELEESSNVGIIGLQEALQEDKDLFQQFLKAELTEYEEGLTKHGSDTLGEFSLFLSNPDGGIFSDYSRICGLHIFLSPSSQRLFIIVNKTYRSIQESTRQRVLSLFFFFLF